MLFDWDLWPAKVAARNPHHISVETLEIVRLFSETVRRLGISAEEAARNLDRALTPRPPAPD